MQAFSRLHSSNIVVSEILQVQLLFRKGDRFLVLHTLPCSQIPPLFFFSAFAFLSQISATLHCCLLIFKSSTHPLIISYLLIHSNAFIGVVSSIYKEILLISCFCRLKIFHWNLLNVVCHRYIKTCPSTLCQWKFSISSFLPLINAKIITIRDTYIYMIIILFQWHKFSGYCLSFSYICSDEFPKDYGIYSQNL